MKAKIFITIIISAIIVGTAVGVANHFFEVNPAITGIMTTAIVVPMSIGIVKIANEKGNDNK
ncbi:MAG: hypothetical protein FWB91_05795 [Defluviitaleaceae bacterium]|nr:hypothetical protein [Defluviitaleaceae bacterium]